VDHPLPTGRGTAFLLTALLSDVGNTRGATRMTADEILFTALTYAHSGRALPNDIRGQLTDVQWPAVLAAYESYIATLSQVSDSMLTDAIEKVCKNVLDKAKEH
jgi:hypothetical protein